MWRDGDLNASQRNGKCGFEWNTAGTGDDGGRAGGGGGVGEGEGKAIARKRKSCHLLRKKGGGIYMGCGWGRVEGGKQIWI